MAIYKRFLTADQGGGTTGPACYVQGSVEGQPFSATPFEFTPTDQASATVLTVTKPEGVERAALIYDKIGNETVLVLVDDLESPLAMMQFASYCATEIGVACSMVTDDNGVHCPPPPRVGKTAAYVAAMLAYRRDPLPVSNRLNLEIGRPTP